MMFSYLGAILAVFLFEFVYKRAMVAVEEVDEEMDDERQEHDALISPNTH